MTEDYYYRKMENNSTSELVDMIRERDKQIIEQEKENEALKNEIINLKGVMDSLQEQIEKMKCCENCKYSSY